MQTPTNIKQALMAACCLILLTLLTACGFRPRSNADLAPIMQKKLFIQFDPQNASVQAALNNLFTSLGIKIVSAPQEAPTTLHITQLTITSNQPSISDSSQAAAITYRLTLNYTLVSRLGQPLYGPTSASAAQTIITAPNQTYINAPNTLKQDLQQHALNQLFNQLTANDAIKTIQTPPIKKSSIKTSDRGAHAAKN